MDWNSWSRQGTRGPMGFYAVAWKPAWKVGGSRPPSLIEASHLWSLFPWGYEFRMQLKKCSHCWKHLQIICFHLTHSTCLSTAKHLLLHTQLLLWHLADHVTSRQNLYQCDPLLEPKIRERDFPGPTVMHTQVHFRHAQRSSTERMAQPRIRGLISCSLEGKLWQIYTAY